MLTRIDHIAIGVSDLEDAIDDYSRRGFTVVEGGRHPAGTHNALISLADGAYIELIAFYEPNPAHPWWSKLERGGGLIDFCLGAADLESEITIFRQAGMEMSDATPGSRMRPDGYNVQWMLSMPTDQYRGVVPFLIEDRTPRSERVPAETKHKNRIEGIDTLTIAVDDLPTIRSWNAQVFQDKGQEIERGDLNGIGVRFVVGSHFIDFVAPAGPAGPLQEWLQERGPSPYGISVRNESGKTSLLIPDRFAK